MNTEVSAEITLGDIHLALSNLADEVKLLRKVAPILQDDIQLVGTKQCPTPSATFVMRLGHGYPPAGKWWQVRHLVVGGADISETPTGTAFVLVTGLIPDENPNPTPPLWTVRDISQNPLPQVAFYGTHELIVQQQQELWVAIVGGTAGVVYSASAMVESFPEFVRGRL